MTGGGIKKGFSCGETDDLGYDITRNPVHVHDFQRPFSTFWVWIMNV